MAQPNLIPMPWAENGQKQDPIPAEQTSAGNGRASWKTGFPIENTRPVSNGGVPANYQDFQGVLHTLSEFACYQQAGGIFTWSDELDYEVGARVLGSDNNVYVAIANSGPASVVTNPVGDTSGKWVTEPNITQASAAALEVASGFVTSGGYTINNGFTVTGGTINGQITSAQYASAIGNTSTNIGSAGIPVYVSGGVITPCDGVAVTSAAQTFSGEKTFTSVISGGVTGNAGTATRLQTARNIQTNLANTSAASFNGTANITPGVTGTLAVANGGTGVTAIADIQAGKDGDGNTITSTYVTQTEYDAAIENLDETKAGKDTVAVNTKNIANIESLLNGALSVQQTDATAAYAKTVLSGAQPYAAIDAIGGKTLCWNQLAENIVVLNDGSGNGLTWSKDSDGTIHINGTSTARQLMFQIYLPEYVIKDHVYFMFGLGLNIHSSGWYLKPPSIVPLPSVTIAKATDTETTTKALAAECIDIGTSFDNATGKFQICDLTLMFGSTIADEIYAMEQATPGAGVAYFKSMFPAAYYAYNAGTLKSAGVTSIVSKNSEDATLVTLPIPSAVQQLPGYGWSAGSVYNYIDWQRKVYVQNVASIDLGTLGWTAGTDTTGQYFYTDSITDRQHVAIGEYPTIVSARYTAALSTNVGDKQIAYAVEGQNRVFVRDTAYTSAADYKAAMSGVMLGYLLDPPVETDISSLLSDDNLLQVEPGGSVTFPSQLGDDYRIPVPSDVEYTIDLAPDTPSTDGTYTLQCVVADGVATYSWVSAE